MLKYNFTNGLVLEVPEQILIIKGTDFIPDGTHYCLSLGKTRHGVICFNISHKNGKDVAYQRAYLSFDTILNMKYEECSLERYLKTRIFL